MNDGDGSSNRNSLSEDLLSKLNELNKKLSEFTPPVKKIGVTEKQVMALVEYMESHNIKLLPGIEGRVMYGKMWLEITDHLNSMEEGCNRSPEYWKKFWSTKIRQAKKKYDKNPLNVTLLEEKILRISQGNDFDLYEEGLNLGMQSEEMVIEPQLNVYDVFERNSPPVSPPPVELPVTSKEPSLPRQQSSLQPQQLLIPPQQSSFHPHQPSNPPQQPSKSPQQPSLNQQQPSVAPQRPLVQTKQQSLPAQIPSLPPQQPFIHEQKLPVPEQVPSSVSHCPSPLPSTSSPPQMPRNEVTQEATGKDSIPGPSSMNPHQRKRGVANIGTTTDIYSYKIKQARLQLEKIKEMNRKEREILRLELETRRIDTDEQLTQALNRIADNIQKLLDKFD